MAPYSSTLAWKIPWTEEPGRLQSMGSQRVGHGASEWPEGIWRKRLTGRDNGRYKDREEGRSMVCPKYGTAA